MILNEENSIGSRIRLIRENSGLTRKDFEEKFGISASTLRAWEEGSRILNPQKAKLLSYIFQCIGVNVSSCFLLTGEEEKVLSKNDADKKIFDVDISQEISINREINVVKSLNPSLVFLQVQDSMMKPLLDKGDTVAGEIVENPHSFSKYIGKICILTKKDGDKIARKVLDIKDSVVKYACLNIFSEDTTEISNSTSIVSIAHITRIWRFSDL